MKEERLRRLLEQIENMSDEEFVQMLEKAGMIVEDIPLGADPEQVIIEMAFEHDYTPRRKPRRTWNVMGTSSIELQSIKAADFKRAVETWTDSDADSFPFPANRYAWRGYEPFHLLTFRNVRDGTKGVA